MIIEKDKYYLVSTLTDNDESYYVTMSLETKLLKNKNIVNVVELTEDEFYCYWNLFNDKDWKEKMMEKFKPFDIKNYGIK